MLSYDTTVKNLCSNLQTSVSQEPWNLNAQRKVFRKMKVQAKKYLLLKSPFLEKTTWQQIYKHLESGDEINVSYFSPNTRHSASNQKDALTKALRRRQRVSSLLSCSLFLESQATELPLIIIWRSSSRDSPVATTRSGTKHEDEAVP